MEVESSGFRLDLGGQRLARLEIIDGLVGAGSLVTRLLLPAQSLLLRVER